LSIVHVTVLGKPRDSVHKKMKEVGLSTMWKGAFLIKIKVKKPGRISPYHEEYGHKLKDSSTTDVTAHVLQTLGENKAHIQRKRYGKLSNG
jgi:hypothetical protein